MFPSALTDTRTYTQAIKGDAKIVANAALLVETLYSLDEFKIQKKNLFSFNSDKI